MKKMENQNSESAWNLTELLARVDNDQELLRELLAIFREDFPRHVESLEKAVAARDLKDTRAVSHALKGMLASLAATRAAAAAGWLENMARDGKKDSLKEGLEALRREVDTLLPELAAYLAEVPL